MPMMEAPAAAKHVELRTETAALDCIALGDRARVDQIVLNLLSNAIRHTSAGGSVTVKCVVSRKDAEIAVIDTGTGVPKDKLEAILRAVRSAGPLAQQRSRGHGTRSLHQPGSGACNERRPDRIQQGWRGLYLHPQVAARHSDWAQPFRGLAGAFPEIIFPT